MISLLTMWKDWGFAPSLFDQAKTFLDLAQNTADERLREGYIRAAIVFAQMAFEAYFLDATRGRIQQSRGSIASRELQKVEQAIESGRMGIKASVRLWPVWVTGKALDEQSTSYKNFGNFLEYRNALAHGKIGEKLPGWGLLAQEVETVEHAALALDTTAAMVKMVATHFGLSVPTWVL